ncbi:MAG: DUF4124 domain-containing protein [Pseudomonadota bacterium]
MTLKYWLIAAALSAAVGASSAELYRWVDASGTVHYSDTPREGAEQIQLKPTNIIRSPRPTASSTTRNDSPPPPAGEEALLPYTAASIQSPSDGETLWNLGGELTVRVNIEPRLQPGHGVVILYNGRPVNSDPVVSSSITINNVYRGQHTVRAAIRDLDGNTLFDGQSVTFFVRQSTAGN